MKWSLSMRGILQVLPTIPREQRTRVAHFLEKQGFKSQALAVTCDPEHKFELALQLGDLKIGYQLAKEAEVRLDSAAAFSIKCPLCFEIVTCDQGE